MFGIESLAILSLSTSRKNVSRMDYKERLREKATTFKREEQDEDSAKEPESCPASISDLVNQDDAQRVVFQSVAVTALQLVDRARKSNIKAAEAAISLGQRERLNQMNAVLTDTMKVLQTGLSSQGEQMLNLCEPNTEETNSEDGHSWWFSLTECIELLEQGGKQMQSLAQSQPHGSAAHHLGLCLDKLFREQHAELLREADQWIA